MGKHRESAKPTAARRCMSTLVRFDSRYFAALRLVVKRLGGNKVVLLSLGYVPANDRKGWWLSPYAPVMWKERDAVRDAFTGYRWDDRAKAVERRMKPNNLINKP